MSLEMRFLAFYLTLLLYTSLGIRIRGVPLCPFEDGKAVVQEGCRVLQAQAGANAVEGPVAWDDERSRDGWPGLGGVPFIYSTQRPDPSKEGTFVLNLQRVALANFTISSQNSSGSIMLWPLELLADRPSSDSRLSMADVRILIPPSVLLRNIAAFNGSNTYTDGTSFLHISKWAEGAMVLTSVTLLSSDCINPASLLVSPSAAAASIIPYGAACAELVTAGNNTVVDALKGPASSETESPLLIYLVQNISLGYPATLAFIRRPIFVIGLASLPTSVDFGMVVNQLSLMDSDLGKVYFMSLYLENLGPGDLATSVVATPYSTLVISNVYAVYFHRKGAVRLTLSNCTVVVPQNEVDFFVFTVTMYSSPLPYVKDKISYVSKGLNVSSYDYVAGPGDDLTIGLFRGKARSWRDVIISSTPKVAPRMQQPPVPAGVLLPDKPAPLLEYVPTVAAMQEDIIDRGLANEPERSHIVMVAAELDLAPNGSWPPPGGLLIQLSTNIVGVAEAAGLDCAGGTSLLVLPANASVGQLTMQRLRLMGLAQGPAAAAGWAGPRRALLAAADGVPAAEWTLMMWAVERQMQGPPSLELEDCELLLPLPEFSYLKSKVEKANKVSVAFTAAGGGGVLQLTEASMVNDQIRAHIHAPGLHALNLTLSPDPAPLPGNYRFSAVPEREQGEASLSPAIIAAIVIGSVAVALVAVLAVLFVLAQRRGSKGDSSCFAGCCGSKPPPGDLPVADARVVPSPSQQLIKDIVPTLPPPSPLDNGGIATRDQHAGSRQGSHVGSRQGSQAYVWHEQVRSAMEVILHRRLGAGAGGDAANSSGSQAAAREPESPGSSTGESCRSAPGPFLPVGSTSGGRPGAKAVQQIMPVELQELLGQGSFGRVYKGTWHGRTVAVKIVNLPIGQAFNSASLESVASMSQEDPVARHLVPQGGKPQMGVMEAAVSTTMSHPNVVRIYTYMLSPVTGGMMAGKGPREVDWSTKEQPSEQEEDCLLGWELHQVLEYCNGGSLRAALDKGRLLGPGPSPHLPVVLSLASDVASALMYLHSEGIVHGDVKTGNVLLSFDASVVGWSGVALGGQAGGLVGVSARVADFGLALLLGPTDTHATYNCWGTPSHMSPELLLHGHVSKASDVYAFAILLWELLTGLKAWAGRPLTLLMADVALDGLRPAWPPGLRSDPVTRRLQQMVERCWATQPSDRPTFAEIFNTIQGMHQGEGEQAEASDAQLQQGRDPPDGGAASQGSASRVNLAAVPR